MGEGFAERGIIASVMDYPHILPNVRAALNPSDFQREKNRIVWQAICELADQGIVGRWDTLLEHLKAAGDLPNIGGVSGLAEMIDGIVRSDDVGPHIQMVKKLALDHRVACAVEQVRLAIEDGEQPGEVLAQHLPKLVELHASLNNQPSSVSANGWPDPRPLPDGLARVPSLPDALIPEAVRPWLADIAERLQVPVEFPATAAIICLSSVVGSQVRIRPKRHDDWTVTPNLWGAVIGRPGVMKSPAIAEPMKALNRLVKQAEAEYEKALRDWRFSKEVAEAKKAARRDSLKKAARAGKDFEAFRAELEEGEDKEPTERRYIVNDATVEKYGELLNQNPNGLLIFRDELTGWLRSLDDERHANDRAFFLEAWNGDDSYTYDRIGRGTLKINNTTTSILGGIQPGPLESYLRNALGYGEGDDGLMQRFQMIVYPDISGDWQNVDRWPETKAKNRAFSIYKYLNELDPRTLIAEHDDGRPFLRFGEDAQELFNEWFVGLNLALRSGEFEHPALEAHFSKYKSLMPSLALIFHLCDAADGKTVGPVSLPAAERAAAWCDFLRLHANRIYGLGLKSTAIHARTLAGHLQKCDLSSPFTARELYRKGWAGLVSAKTVEEPLSLLEDLGWLRSVQVRTDLGRPTIHYIINPKIGGQHR
jgi:uncharacterized protein DUF3987/DnaB helicase-like protein